MLGNLEEILFSFSELSSLCSKFSLYRLRPTIPLSCNCPVIGSGCPAHVYPIEERNQY